MLSSALVLAIIFLLWQTRWRLFSIVAGSLLVMAIGASRLYVGVHYPTDILAGWCVSAAWVVIIVTHTKVTSSMRHHTGLEPKQQR
jgi:membrane-associated phospholipid phosphatase